MAEALFDLANLATFMEEDEAAAPEAPPPKRKRQRSKKDAGHEAGA